MCRHAIIPKKKEKPPVGADKGLEKESITPSKIYEFGSQENDNWQRIDTVVPVVTDWLYVQLGRKQ